MGGCWCLPPTLSGPPHLSRGVDADKAPCLRGQMQRPQGPRETTGRYLSQSEGEDLARRPCSVQDCPRHEGTQGLRSLRAKRTELLRSGRATPGRHGHTSRRWRGRHPARGHLCKVVMGGYCHSASQSSESTLTDGPESRQWQGHLSGTLPQRRVLGVGAGSQAQGSPFATDPVTHCSETRGGENGGESDPSPHLCWDMVCIDRLMCIDYGGESGWKWNGGRKECVLEAVGPGKCQGSKEGPLHPPWPPSYPTLPVACRGWVVGRMEVRRGAGSPQTERLPRSHSPLAPPTKTVQWNHPPSPPHGPG